MTNKTSPANNPPFIQTRGFRLLAETDRPERFLRPEYFRAGRGAGPALAERDTGTWINVDRHDLARDRVADDNGQPCDLSRLVITTDAGVGKTTELHWLESELNRADGQSAAFFLTFSQLPARADGLIDEVLVPRLLRAAAADATADPHGDARRVLERLRDEGRLTLLLDALDQAPADGAVVQTLRDLLLDARWQRCRFVVSGRPHALQRHWAALFAAEHAHGWRFVQLDEFDERQQREFLGKNDAGRDRFDFVPAEAREILSTPRVLEYLRGLPDGELKQIQTAGDVYWRAVEHLLTEGMRNSRAARQIGLAVGEQPPANVQARSLYRARQLLGAIAFEMTSTPITRRDPESGDEQQVPNFDGVRRGRFGRFRQRLVERLAAGSTAAESQLLGRDFDGLAALNDFVSQGFFDTVEGLQEIFWRNRTLQEFFTAYWLSQHCSPQDVEGLRDWIYLRERPLTEEYYWVWRFLCEMHDDAVDPVCWTRAVEPIFRPGDGTMAGTRRSGELIYRAWAPLQQLADEGEVAAREVLVRFLGEFEDEILSGNRGPDVREIARQFCENFVELPAGEFRMGAPPEKQGISDDVREQWQEFLQQEGDPSERAVALVDEWYTFTPGKSGQSERRYKIDWWTPVFRERDLDAIIVRQYPGDETPQEPTQTVNSLMLNRWPTVNAWYRLFSPGHGQSDSYYREKYAEISPQPDTPVIFVTWYDAWAFCQWAHWDGQSCHLPREYEWEYAAKAGTDWQQNYWWGDEFDADRCNGDNRIGHATPPDEAHANLWRLVDMLGNVWEWTVDEYRHSYDRDKPPDSSARVLRGGSWYNFGYSCRSAYRDHGLPSNSDYDIGFRLARARKP